MVPCEGEVLAAADATMGTTTFTITDFLGWSSWSEWSSCSNDGIRLRHRRCLVEQPAALECHGAEFEKTACVPGECEGKLKNISDLEAFILIPIASQSCKVHPAQLCPLSSAAFCC